MTNKPEIIMLQLKTCPVCNGKEQYLPCSRCNGQGQLVIIPNEYRTMPEDLWDRAKEHGITG